MSKKIVARGTFAFIALLSVITPNLMADDAMTLLADFDVSIQTGRGGFYQSWGGRPDQVSDELVAMGEPQQSAWRIELTEQAPANGAGGLVALFDARAAKRGELLEIAQGSELCIRILGNLDQRRAKIEIVAGANPEAAGTTIGMIGSDKIDPNIWSELRLTVPRDFAGAKRAGFVRILIEGEGAAWLAIDSLGVTSDAAESVAPKSAESHSLRKALWFWNTEEILPDSVHTAALLELCRTQEITDIYCQILYTYEDGNIQMRLVDEQRAFNAAAESLGITAHALDGQADYVFSKNHPRMFRLMEALGEMNEQSAPSERFRAVHLDNEPYVLPGWQKDDERRQIIHDYIVLNKELRRKADALGMEFGVDIPFWWDDRDRDGNAKFTYDTEAGQQPILEALFPLVHNVGIMSYRDRATGPNGTVAHCLDEFKLGKELGVDVFASIELGVGKTVDPGTTYGIYPWAYFRRQFSTLETILSHTPGCAGLAIHYARPFAEAVK